MKRTDANSPQWPERAGNRRRIKTPRARWCAILPLLRFRVRKALGERPVIILLLEGSEISTWERLLVYRARQVGCNGQSLRRWCDRFNESGYAGLKDAPRRNQGTSHVFSGRSAAVALVFTKYVEGRSVREIYDALAETWPHFYPGAPKPPSCASVRAFIKLRFPAIRKSPAPVSATAVRP